MEGVKCVVEETLEFGSGKSSKKSKSKLGGGKSSKEMQSDPDATQAEIQEVKLEELKQVLDDRVENTRKSLNCVQMKLAEAGTTSIRVQNQRFFLRAAFTWFFFFLHQSAPPSSGGVSQPPPLRIPQSSRRRRRRRRRLLLSRASE